MGLKDELDARFEGFSDRAEELSESWDRVSEEDLNTVLGKWFGLAYEVIGQLVVTVGEIAEHIDALESR